MARIQRIGEHGAVKSLRRGELLLGLVVVLTLMGCGVDGQDTPEPEPTTADVVARCTKAMGGSNPPAWREEATVAGPFGLFGVGRDFQGLGVRRTSRGFFLAKIPAVLDGHKSVILRVPSESIGEVGLGYGGFNEPRSVEGAASSVQFKPCTDKPTTSWPGGLILVNRRPVTLVVELPDGQQQPIRIGRL